MTTVELGTLTPSEAMAVAKMVGVDADKAMSFTINADGTVTAEHQTCPDCGTDELEGFYVHDELWNQAVPEDGRICLKCLSKRLGRPLKASDFQSEWKVNDKWRKFF